MFRFAPLLAVVPTLILLLQPAAALRVAVIGGTGFIGKRVCRQLVAAGCSVVSVSRRGAPPELENAGSWARDVEWVTADAFNLRSGEEKLVVGPVDAAVSLVGNCRPAPSWAGFWGLHFDHEAGVRENGLVNEQIATYMKTACGARRMVFVTISSTAAKAFEGRWRTAYVHVPQDGRFDAVRSSFLVAVIAQDRWKDT